MPGNLQSFFQDMTPEDQAALARHTRKKHFPAGSILLVVGDNPSELYIIQSGRADVYVADRNGTEQLVAHAGPGDAVGEMSLITGRPVSATVRAAADVETLVLDRSDFDKLATLHPLVYRNLAILLFDRLRRSHQRALRAGLGSITLLRDFGAPPLLAYALACSLAWHTHRPILLVVVGDVQPAELQPFASDSAALNNEALQFQALQIKDVAPGARVVLTKSEGEYSDESLAPTLDRLLDQYDHVLLLANNEALQFQALQLKDPLPDLNVRTIYLAGPAGETPTNGPGPLTTIRGWVEGPKPPRPDRVGTVYVPQPEGTDLEALGTGLLPISTACGRAIGWAARDLAGLKVGVALGAGSDKGYAHIGVLRVLAKAGISVDYLAGASVGSGVGIACAMGYDADMAGELLDRVGASAFRLHLPGSSLLSNEGLREGIRSVVGDSHFEDLNLPLAVVAADIVSGREVVFKSGLVWPALLASMSIPGVYPPQRMGEYILVDGGVLNPVPVNVVAGMGANRVIAVKLAAKPAMPAIEDEASITTGRPPSLLKTLARTMEVMQSKIVTDTAATATVLLEPDLHEAGDWREMRHFEVGHRYIERGEEVAEAALPSIATVLPWLR